MNLYQDICQELDDFTALRRHLHQHPELGFEEHATAALVADKLREYEVDQVHTGIGGTGVVGIIQGRPGEERIGLRADMDCLSMTEENTFAHASCHQGKMHGCGHDGHTTILLAAARHLCRHRNFSGQVVLIFQPAEEGLGGARAMIDDGLLERFPCKRVYALHNFPRIPQGHIHLRPGPMMASSDNFHIRIIAQGGHGAMPHLANDPVVIAANLILSLQTIVSRNIDPIQPAVVSCTMMHTGEATNVIPDSATLQGTLRAFSAENRALIRERIETLAHHIAAGFGAKAEVGFNQGKQVGYPPLVNEEQATRIALQAAEAVVGKDRVLDKVAPVPGSEDFSYIAEAVPSCYVLLGNDRDHDSPHNEVFLHHPRYDFNDAIIPVGASYFVKLVELELG
ncbi:hippurate hydrolase [Oceanisphaera litoralis]|uniref:M20 aminoacylase family protein n=1 Tax=Oceanisphaera litoralis TaxID=225144 RepID=UPI0019570507|nr:M20 aminoacylase family protein [Oceanisphaera litoralis]MBM7454191.1 hippurate hydrolase [Oceanisphaera litoralis]